MPKLDYLVELYIFADSSKLCMQALYFYPNYLLLIAGLFLIAIMIQLFYYWYFFGRLAFYRRPTTETPDQPVSVVICAHNEAYSLLQNLPLILEQDYPDYEVIVVNDTSTDESKEILLELSQIYPNLKIVNVSNSVTFFRSKKFPLSVGIKSAQNEILLLTDADCIPASNQWIRNMQARFTDQTSIVLGFSPYPKKPGLLNLLIRFDTFHIALQYFSYALAGLPYMGVGRNLAYRKSLFYEQKGFISHYKIGPGDDDLFVNGAATRRNTVIEIEKNSHTISKLNTSLDAWIIQKRRHFTTGEHYRTKFKVVLGIYSGSGIAYYLLLAALLIFKFEFYWILGIHAFRMITRLVLMGLASKKLNQKSLFLSSLLLDPFFAFFNPFLAMSNTVSPSQPWK
ncbi:MAG: glycosyltransferase [Bacteroidales bacterium]|nr:glycosyltransferase [Bacteroidales bacterium]